MTHLRIALLGVFGLSVSAAIVRWQAARHWVKEPAFALLAREQSCEIRLYPAYVVAETRVQGRDARAVSSEGFRRIARYIFGGNHAGQSIAMTAPVMQQAQGERIAMTAPVTQAQGDGQSFVIAFVLPAGRSREEFPTPNDNIVTLRTVPERRVATLRFAGSVAPDIVAQHTHELRNWLAARNEVPAGEPTLARYDPPSTLGFLRRNEIWIELGDAPSAHAP
ncbi:MAG: heme-binding protein [Deltaproteobacteria bacterium]|nr:heme-binding protein [Deltaproteobacteria bacterium]